MAFNVETVRHMDRHMRQVDLEIERIERFVRPHRSMLDQINSNLANSNLTSTLLDNSSFTLIQQQMQGATRPIWKGLQAHVGLMAATQTAGIYQGFAASANPLWMFMSDVNTRMVRETTKNAWRPVLMRDQEAIGLAATQSDILKNVGGIAAATQKLNTSLAASVGFDLHSVLGEATRMSSTWAGLAESLENHRLFAVRTMPLPPNRATIQRWPESLPLRQKSIATPPAVSTTEKHESAMSMHEETQDFRGVWTILQPMENTIQRIVNGPLMVKILFIGLGQMVIGVIVGGIVYLLFYCC